METKDSLKINVTLRILIESFIISLGTFGFGYNMAALNQSQSCIEIVNEWSPSEKKYYDGLLTSLLPLGAICGSILTAYISEKVGKRLCLIFMDFIGIFANFIMIFQGAPLFIGRFFVGIVTGANSVTVASYINEISPPEILPKAAAIISIMINFGIFFAFVLGLNFPNEEYMIAHRDELNWWKFMLVFPIITYSLRTLLFVFFIKTDTPHFYISRNREEDTRTVLQKYYKEESVDLIFNELKKKHEYKHTVSILDLFNYKMKNRTLVGIFLNILQQFSGINAVIFYSNKIFMNSENGNDYHAKVFTSLIGILLILTAYLSGKFVSKYGRRTLLLFGLLSCGLSLFLLMLFCWLKYESPTKYMIFIFIICFGVSLGPVVFVYLPEILPEKGVGLAIMTNWFSCFLIGLLFPILLDTINIEGSFLIFCVITLLGFIFANFFVLETKSKTKEEIERMFMSKTKEGEEENSLKL